MGDVGGRGNGQRHRSGQARRYAKDHVRRAGTCEGADPAGRRPLQRRRQAGVRRNGSRQPRRGHRHGDEAGAEISAGRPARLATGADAGWQVLVDDQRRFERRIGRGCGRPEGDQIDSGRFVSLGRRDLETMTAVTAAPPKTAISALSVENVSHAYGARIALNKVSFDVAPSSFTVLLGLNGAGKSTLFSVITHLYASRSGVVRIFGRDVARESGAALALLGVVFQQRTLDPDLSVAQNLAYH